MNPTAHIPVFAYNILALLSIDDHEPAAFGGSRLNVVDRRGDRVHEELVDFDTLSPEVIIVFAV